MSLGDVKKVCHRMHYAMSSCARCAKRQRTAPQSLVPRAKSSHPGGRKPAADGPRVCQIARRRAEGGNTSTCNPTGPAHARRMPCPSARARARGLPSRVSPGAWAPLRRPRPPGRRGPSSGRPRERQTTEAAEMPRPRPASAGPAAPADGPRAARERKAPKSPRPFQRATSLRGGPPKRPRAHGM